MATKKNESESAPTLLQSTNPSAACSWSFQPNVWEHNKSFGPWEDVSDSRHIKKKNTRCSEKRRDAKIKEQSNKHCKVSNTQKEPSQKISAHLTEKKKKLTSSSTQIWSWNKCRGQERGRNTDLSCKNRFIFLQRVERRTGSWNRDGLEDESPPTNLQRQAEGR